MKKLLYTTIAIFGFANFTMAQVPSYVPTNGLIGWWPFNGNANDESGNKSNGIVTGATLTKDRFNKESAAYLFNGTSDYILIPKFNKNIESNFTISFWVKIQESDEFQVFLSKGEKEKGHFEIYSYGRTHKLSWHTLEMCSDVQSSFKIDDNQIHHIVAKQFNDQLMLYVDGQKIHAQGCSGKISETVGDLTIGRLSNQIGSFLFTKGIIDDIGIWNRALNDEEIHSLYSPDIKGLCKDKTTGCKFYTYNSENRYGIWSGTCKDGLIDGSGILRLFEGDSLILISNCTYIGGYRNGESIDTFTSGILYFGSYVNGEREGKGKMVFPDGQFYEGDWKNGAYDGKGKNVMSDGRIYNGDWKNGKHNGMGFFSQKNKKTYFGEWKDDSPEGNGRMVLLSPVPDLDSMVYTGIFRGGLMIKGKEIWYSKDATLNGATYEGEGVFIGVRSGIFTEYSPNGQVFSGEYQNGYKYKGKTTYTSGDIHDGELNKDGSATGKGTYFWKDGQRYNGEFKEGKINGQGTMTYTNGLKDIGIWESGKLVTRDASSTTKLPQTVKNTPLKQEPQILKSTESHKCNYCRSIFYGKGYYLSWYDGDFHMNRSSDDNQELCCSSECANKIME